MRSLPAAEPQIARPVLRAGVAACGLGVALPARRVGNDEAARLLEGVDAAWIERRTGIRERRWASPGDQLHRLAATAGDRALDEARVDADDLDLVIVATVSADEATPACAPRVAAALGAPRAGALDVGAACTGFVAALALGGAWIEAGRAERVLVVGAEHLSRLTDRRDRQTAALFGDGAGAVVLEAAAESRIGPAVLGADGANADLIRAPRETGRIAMDGHTVFGEAVRRMGNATREACTAAGIGLAAVDLFVFHQANARILAALTERLELPEQRVVSAISTTGNTSAASIPLALAGARDAGQLTPGARLLLAAFGAGLTWGAITLTWGHDG